MAEAEEKTSKQLEEITECPICLSDFTDPRMLSCIHTFCLSCLKDTAEKAQKKPGDKLPCPMCRKEFDIPAEGLDGVLKNFFMENLFELKTTLQRGTAAIIICDACNIRNEDKTGPVPKATFRCLECQDTCNYCDSCIKVHQFRIISKDHQVEKIGSDTKQEVNRPSTTKYCSEHTHNPLGFYCADCKKIVCVSCFVETHKLHDCKDVKTVGNEFRETIQRNSSKVAMFADEMLTLRNNAEIRKADFLKNLADKENAIHERNQELKAIIDEHTRSLLDELSAVKSKHLKKMETRVEEIDRYCTILTSFDAYCSALISKGSASDICSSIDQLIVRTDELERDHEAFISRPRQSVEVSFLAKDSPDALQKSVNCLGEVKETTTQFENDAVVVGLDGGTTTTKDVVRISLHKPNENITRYQTPFKMAKGVVSAAYSDTMYVTGIGGYCNEIWNYSVGSGWKKCASLVQGRRKHSAAFVDEVLYICGGNDYYYEKVLLDSVEAYSAVDNKCTKVGQLVYRIGNAGNCVPFKGSLYIFGGTDETDKEVDYVQVYNTKHYTCSILSKPMPTSSSAMRAAICETSVILVGQNTCFMFNFETETWQERQQFKTDAVHFGLVLENNRVFVIGGGVLEKDKYGRMTWNCRDDVRYVPLSFIIDDKSNEWKICATLPKPSLIHACEKLTYSVALQDAG